MTNQPDPIQSQIITARRNQILAAATQVFAQKGFHQTTIRDIARQAGIADGTIYNYFANKNELLIAILDRLNESEKRPSELGAAAGQDFRTFFVTYLQHRLELLLANRQLFQALLPELLVNPLLHRRYFEQVIAPSLNLGEQFFQGQMAAGHLSPADAQLLTRTMVGTILGLLLMDLLGDEQLSQRWAELPNFLATIFVK